MGLRHTIDVQSLRRGVPRDRATTNALEDETHALRQTFMGEKLPAKAYDTGISWSHVTLRHVGTCESVSYASDKWGGREKKRFEEFKHVVEAPQELYAIGRALPASVPGPVWKPKADGVILPRCLAEMAPLLFLESRLHVGLDRAGEGVLGHGDDGCYRIHPAGCLLYVGYLIDAADETAGEPCLVVASKREGAQFLIRGRALNVTRDGIVG